MSIKTGLVDEFEESNPVMKDLDGEFDLDDEVFTDDNADEGVELRDKSPPQPRVRRVSDVIDSMGEGSPIHRHLAEVMEGLDCRRMSDPAGTQTLKDLFPSRHSEGSAAQMMGSERPKSIYLDQGYGSSSMVAPTYLVYPTSMDSIAKPANDTIDAQPYRCPNSAPGVEAPMCVERDAHEYNMNHPRRGKAVILNHDTFNIQGFSSRSGSETDVKNLTSTYSGLGFETVVHNNLSYQEIKDVIDALSKEDYSDADCFCLTVLTHGLGNNFLLANDVPYSVDQLWTPFTADRCVSLAGKPKLFVFQACRGESLDPGVTLVRNRTRSETDSTGSSSYKIPTHADFLMAYSSVEGFYSWRNPENGTWFIQCLCQELRERAHDTELLKLLTNVSRRVALDYQSYNDILPWQHEQKQVPSVVSMLIRELHFRPK